MKYLKKSNLLTRFNLIIGLLLLLVFSISATILLQLQKKNNFLMTENQMNSNINELFDYYDVLIKQNKKGLTASINYASHLFSMMGQLVEKDSVKIEMDAVNQVTNSHKKVWVNQWFLSDTLIQQNHYILDRFNILASANASIYQKIPEGYLCITTNIIEENGRQATGSYIPNSSPIIESIERGQIFQGRSYINNQWQLTAYQPIYIGNQIKGLLFFGVLEVNDKSLEQLFVTKKYFGEGYPFLVDKNGKYLFHPFQKGQSIEQTYFFEQFSISASRVKTFRYFQNVSNAEVLLNKKSTVTPLDEYLKFSWSDLFSFWKNEDIWKHVYYRYHKPTDTFVVGILDENQLGQMLSSYRRSLMLVIIVFLVIVLSMITWIVQPFLKGLFIIKQATGQFALGGIPEPINQEFDKEISEIAVSVNQIAENTHKVSLFLDEIGKGNFDFKFTPKGDEDVVGQSLIKMQKNLLAIRMEQQRREQEDNKQKWISQGFALMSEIMRKFNDNIEALSFEVISFLVRYLDANQGGFFMLNDANPTDKYFEQLACYAFDKKRLITKKIPYNQGLLGRCLLEKKMLFFTDVPSDYAEINSGLGGSTPRYLLFMPLKMNDVVLGVIEIASFYEINATHLEFIERGSITIASTISTVKINEQTSHLLEQTNLQAEVLSTIEFEKQKALNQLDFVKVELFNQSLEIEGLNAAIDTSIIAAVYDLKGNILKANQNMFDAVGYTEDELKDKNILLFVPEEGKSEFIKLWNQIKEGQSFSGEIKRISKLGKPIWQLASYTPIRNQDGEIYRIYYLGHNITEIKNLEIEAIELANNTIAKNNELSDNYQKLQIKYQALHQKYSEFKSKLKFTNKE